MQVWNRSADELAPRRQRATASEGVAAGWIEADQAETGEALEAAASITMVSDRESHFYELFAQRRHNVDLIVRACQNRRIEAQHEPGLLFTFIDAQARAKPLFSDHSRRARTPRTRRRTGGALRAGDGAAAAKRSRSSVARDGRSRHWSTFARPRNRTDGSDPVHWRLLTTHSVATVTQARRVVDLYRSRWTIEEFFRTLKTAGFDIEAADIGDPHAMINFVAAATVAAVTIKQLVQARDGNTDQRLRDAFDPDDQPISRSRLTPGSKARPSDNAIPIPKGSLAFAAWVITRLGGWTGYYGKPGPKVMRIGLAEFSCHQVRNHTQCSSCVNPIDFFFKKNKRSRSVGYSASLDSGFALLRAPPNIFFFFFFLTRFRLELRAHPVTMARGSHRHGRACPGHATVLLP